MDRGRDTQLQSEQGLTRNGSLHKERVLFRNETLRRHLFWWTGHDVKTPTENRKPKLGPERGTLSAEVCTATRPVQLC